MVDLKCVFKRLRQEKDLSHSQDVIGRVARIIKATLIFSNPGNFIYFKVKETLFGRVSLFR